MVQRTEEKMNLDVLRAKHALIKGLAKPTANSSTEEERIQQVCAAAYSQGVSDTLDAVSAELAPLLRRKK